MATEAGDEEPLGTVWCLESGMEQDYSYLLGEYIRETDVSKDPEHIQIIRSFWDNEDEWDEIVKKSQTEGSTWYVWWMDGVRAYIRYDEKQAEEDWA